MHDCDDCLKIVSSEKCLIIVAITDDVYQNHVFGYLCNPFFTPAREHLEKIQELDNIEVVLHPSSIKQCRTNANECRPFCDGNGKIVAHSHRQLMHRTIVGAVYREFFGQNPRSGKFGMSFIIGRMQSRHAHQSANPNILQLAHHFQRGRKLLRSKALLRFVPGDIDLQQSVDRR